MWNIDEFLSGLNIDLDRLRDVFTYDPQAPMIFSSGIFLWLFVAFILVYLLLQRRTTARLLFVTLFSYYFYYKSSGTYFFLLGLVTVCDFFIACLMAREAIPWLRKAWVVLSLFINLGLLCYIHQFPGRNFCLADGRHVHDNGYFSSGGHLFFHFSVVELYDRCVPSPDNASDQFCWIMLFMFLSFPSWWRGLLYVPVISFRKSAVRCLSPGRCSDVESSSS